MNLASQFLLRLNVGIEYFVLGDSPCNVFRGSLCGYLGSNGLSHPEAVGSERCRPVELFSGVDNAVGPRWRG